MRITYLLSVLLLAGAIDASPLFAGKHNSRNATIAAIYQRRQTTRQEVALRAHVKKTVKLVHANLNAPVTRETDFDDEDDLDLEKRTPTKAEGIAARGAPMQPRATIDARAQLARRQLEEAPAATEPEPLLAARAGPLRPRASDDSQAIVPRRMKNERAEHRGSDLIREALADDTKLDRRAPLYPKCKKSGARTGYAHYPGWKLAGDDLSGGIPISPESACVTACNKYGGSCSGVYFDAASKKCFLKGVHTAAWSFFESGAKDGVNLVGGCALWSNVVPPEMDEVCCRD